MRVVGATSTGPASLARAAAASATRVHRKLSVSSGRCGRYLMINEDGTTESRAVMAAKGRDGSIWRFDLVSGRTGTVGVDASTATRIAELNPPGRDGVPVGPGVWETSGIIDASALFGADTWLSDVQAHPPTTPPGGPTVTVEDGQLFVMSRAG